MKAFAVLGTAALWLFPTVTAQGSFSSVPKPSGTATPSCLPPYASMTGGPSLSASPSLPPCSETPSNSAKDGGPTPRAKGFERVHARQIKRVDV
ncbi:hypothetical protein SI65_05778 [Aspergillus cristatus]|uniref:Uncharacterized protein n=1 Tax=Aspergillus cristatus TaxID=573508 RepID=A0A1E3BEF9_ASPCR|nr:hypothetical protein SI65_05778 [Aspergillus cristatus]